jgi:hypothetical protein
MNIRIPHGCRPVPGGIKPMILTRQGHEVINPKLPDEDFLEAGRIPQAEFDEHGPTVVIRSPTGGAVAMNRDISRANLPCSARPGRDTELQNRKARDGHLARRRRRRGAARRQRRSVKNSEQPATALVKAGNDHRSADPGPLAIMLKACEGRLGLPVLK